MSWSETCNTEVCCTVVAHSSRVTKFVVGRSSNPDPAGGAPDVPRLRIRLRAGTPFPIVQPSMPSVSRSRHLAFQPLHWSVPIFPSLRNDHCMTNVHNWTHWELLARFCDSGQNLTLSLHSLTLISNESAKFDNSNAFMANLLVVFRDAIASNGSRCTAVKSRMNRNAFCVVLWLNFT